MDDRLLLIINFRPLHSFTKSIENNLNYPEDKLIELAKAVKKLVDDKAKYTDWNKRDDIKTELEFDLMILLDEWGYPPVDSKEVYKEIFKQAENSKKHRVV